MRQLTAIIFEQSCVIYVYMQNEAWETAFSQSIARKGIVIDAGMFIEILVKVEDARKFLG